MTGCNDGGAAFPALARWSDAEVRYVATGMTLRAYFAAHAPEVPESYAFKRTQQVAFDGLGGKGLIQANEPAMARIIRWRLEYADAMLKALK